MIGWYSTTRVGSMPQEAATITVGRASSIRAASSRGAKPPNTTECTAPIRAQASMAMTASGTIGMKIDHPIARFDTQSPQPAGETGDHVTQFAVGVPAPLAGHRRVPEQGGLVAAGCRRGGPGS